jgi:hypothetical protein
VVARDTAQNLYQNAAGTPVYTGNMSNVGGVLQAVIPHTVFDAFAINDVVLVVITVTSTTSGLQSMEVHEHRITVDRGQ